MRPGTPSPLNTRYLSKRFMGVWPFIPIAARPAPELHGVSASELCPPYIVIYEYDRAKDVVTILRIVHGRRKITGKLLRGV
jgi:hypothetical protein